MCERTGFGRCCREANREEQECRTNPSVRHETPVFSQCGSRVASATPTTIDRQLRSRHLPCHQSLSPVPSDRSPVLGLIATFYPTPSLNDYYTFNWRYNVDRHRRDYTFDQTRRRGKSETKSRTDS